MKQYYIIQNGEKVGPLGLEELISNGLNAQTMVWSEGMTDWMSAGQLEELRSVLGLDAPSSSIQGQTNSASQSSVPPVMHQAFYQPPVSNRPIMPPNYLVWSVLVTIFCCLPLGIIAIVYSSQVSSCYARGDYEGALVASRNARSWIKWSVICFVIGVAIYLIVAAIMGVSLFSLVEWL